MIEALRSEHKVARLHIARNIKHLAIMQQLIELAEVKEAEIKYHSRRELSYISKNSRQDQGVAIDLIAPKLNPLADLPSNAKSLIILNGITNPSNLGIIIRSVAASPLDGLVLPEKGNAAIGPLVYKASAGFVLRANIYQCETIISGLNYLQSHQFKVFGLSNHGETALNKTVAIGPTVFVLGNESTGLSSEVEALCDQLVSIPMANGVESINVSAAATLVAFHFLY